MLKAVWKSISKNKLPVIFIIIQISFMFYMLNSSMDSFFAVGSQEKFLSGEIKDNRDKLLRISIEEMPSQTLGGKILKLENNIGEMPEVKANGGLDAPYLNFDNFKNHEGYKLMIEEQYGNRQRGAQTEVSDVLLIDEGMEELLNLNVSEGRSLSKEDFNLESDKVVPILLGAKFKDFMKEGDILIDSIIFDEKKKYVVVGFLENESSAINVDGQYISNVPTKLDTFVLIPNYEEMNNLTLHINSKMDSYFVIVNEGNQLEKVRGKIRGEMQKLGIAGEVYSYEEELIAFKNEYKQINNTAILLIGFLFIMALFSIISAILFSIKKRKYNLGVMITCGASVRYIKKIILLELGIILSLGFLIGNGSIIIENIIGQIGFSNQSLDIQKSFNLEQIYGMFAITIVFIIMAAYIPLKKLDKISAKNLVGGKE